MCGADVFQRKESSRLSLEQRTKKSEFTAASPQRSTSASHLSIPVGAILSQYSVKSTSPQHSLFSTLPTVASPQHLTSAFLSEPNNISALTLSSQHSNSLHSHTKPYYTNKTISALLLSSQHSTPIPYRSALVNACYKAHTHCINHVIKAHTHTTML